MSVKLFDPQTPAAVSGGGSVSNAEVGQLSQQLSSQAQTVQGQISDATTSLQSITDSISQTTGMLNSLMAGRDSLFSQISLLRGQAGQAGLSDAQKKSFSDQIASLQSQLVAQSQQIDAVSQKLTSLQAQSADKQKQINGLRGHDLPAAQGVDDRKQAQADSDRQSEAAKKAQDSADSARNAAAAAIAAAQKAKASPLDIDYSKEG